MASQPFLTRRSIAASRLKPPQLPRSFVSRSQILEDVSGAKFIAVVAPGGYGKTCLLAELVRAAPKSVWYTVRAEDSDPSSLVFGLGTALATEASDYSQETHDLLATLAETSPEVGAELLARLAATIDGPWLLALDDCHLLDPESGSVTILDRFLADAPQEMRFAYNGRTPLTLSTFSRAQAAGIALEIGPPDLRFDSGLAGEALQGESLSKEQVDHLTRLCEGWPALIRLAASLLGRAGGTLEGPGGDRAAVYKYIATELFGKLRPAAQNLLLKTSFCDSFTSAMADTLVAGPTAALIREAEGGGWLQQTKTDEGIAYSYHPLLADFLWSRFTTEAPSNEVKQALIAAGDWMAARERWDEAFTYWKRAEAAEKIVEQLYVWEQGYVDYWPVHGRWLNILSVEDLSSRPRLILRKALGYQLSCNVNEAFRWQAIAEDIIAKSGDVVAGVDARANRAQILFFAWRVDEAEQMYRALAQEADSLIDRQKSGAYTGLALLQMHNCRELDKAVFYLEEVRKLSAQTQNWRGVCLAVGNLLTVYRLTGQFDSVMQLLTEYRNDDAGQSFLPRLYHSLGMAAWSGDLARPEFEGAVRDCLQHCQLSNFNWLISSMRASLAIYLAEQGRLEEAERCIEEWTRTPSTHEGVAMCIEVARALVGAQRGDKEEALRRLARTRPHYSSMGTFEPNAALAYLLLGNRETASVRASAAAAECRSRGLNFLEAGALYMLAAADGATSKDLQRLFDLCKAFGYESMFLCRWPQLAPKVLTQALARNVEPEYVSKLLRQTGKHTLRVQTFGGLRVWLNEVELDDQAWERPKSKALFAYLLTRGSKSGHSEEIAELFWPDQDLAAAKNSLRVAATRVRKAIERDEKLLVFDADHYRLDLGDASWQDRSAFEQLTEAGLAADDPAAAVDFLHQALSIYSDEFLPEYRYEEWAATERERLETIRRRARLRLGKHLIALNRSKEAIRVCEAATSSDPLDEAAVRLQLVALAELDRQDEARKVFLRLETDLSKQLNSKPTAATLKLVRELGVV